MSANAIGLRHLILGPLRALRDPAGSAAIFVRCPFKYFLAITIFQAFLMAFVIVLISLAAAGFDTTTGNWLSPAQARRALNGGAVVGACEAIFCAAICAGLMFPLVMAAFFLPLTLRSGSVLTALGRGYRAAAALLTVLTAMVGVFVGGFVAAVHLDEWLLYAGQTDARFSLPMLVQICLWSGAALFLSNVRKAMSAASESGGPEIPPRCEGCGYDLSHQPASGLCSECSESIARSLTPGVRRPGVRWEREPRDFSAWCSSTMQVLFAPSRFYGRMAVRSGQESAYLFSLLQFRYLGFVAALWVASMFVVMNLIEMMSVESLMDVAFGACVCAASVLALAQGTPLGRFQPPKTWHGAYFLVPVFLAIAMSRASADWTHSNARDALLVPLLFGLLAPMGCWMGHRLGAFLVMGFAIRARTLADFRWAEKIICYESAYLWIYCICWGVLATSMMIFGPWMSRLHGFDELRRLTGLPAEPASILATTAFLSLIWIVRYRIALRAVRWNNF